MSVFSLPQRMALTLLARGAGLMSGSGSGGRLFILIYHQVLDRPDPLRPGEVDIATFNWQMALLRQYLNVLPLGEAVRRLREGSLPPRAVSVTFDDGYRNNFTNALPVLESHGLQATFFVASGFLDGGRMWNDTVIETFRTTSEQTIHLDELGLPLLRLDSEAARHRAVNQVIDAIKHLPFDERAAWVERISAFAGRLPDGLMMSSDEVRALHERGMTIGGHTVNHPILAKLSEKEARQEILDGKAALESLIGEPVDFFAYPNGRAERDYLDRDVELVREAGFRAAVSTNPGASNGLTDVMQLRRFTPWDRSPSRFLARITRYYR